MNGSAVIEVFGHIFVSFTQSVSERFNPEEPEFTAESSGYEPLQSTGLEWNYLPVDELIYQEYSDREVRTLNYQTDVTCKVRVVDSCSLDDTKKYKMKGRKKMEQWHGSDLDYLLSAQLVNQCTLELSFP